MAAEQFRALMIESEVPGDRRLQNHDAVVTEETQHAALETVYEQAGQAPNGAQPSGMMQALKSPGSLMQVAWTLVGIIGFLAIGYWGFRVATKQPSAA